MGTIWSAALFGMFIMSYMLFIGLRADELRSRETILSLLRRHEEMSGPQLIESSSRVLDQYNVYPLLRKMEREGLLESRENFDAGAYLMRGERARILYRLKKN